MIRWTAWVALGVGCGAGDGAMEVSGAATIAPGEDVQLTATVHHEDGTDEDVTADADWSSSDEAVAVVDAGLVSGIAAGAATISATFDGVTADAEVEVEEADAGPYAVRVFGDWSPQHGGQGRTVFARVVDDADGSVVACGSEVADDAIWSLSAEGVLVAGRTYHAEAFADVSGDGLPNDAGHMYLSGAKPPASKDQSFEVLHSGPAPAWDTEACAAGVPPLIGD